MSQLLQLSRPLPSEPERGITRQGYSGKYLTHTIVEQFLLMTLGPYSFEVLQPVLGDMPSAKRGEKEYPALTNVVVGAICKLTVNVDGRKIIITEVGDCPNVYDGEHDGQRLQQAASRGLVRCAMRLGLGLQLWCKEFKHDEKTYVEPYFLYRVLSEGKGIAGESQPSSSTGTPADPVYNEHESGQPNGPGFQIPPDTD